MDKVSLLRAKEEGDKRHRQDMWGRLRVGRREKRLMVLRNRDGKRTVVWEVASIQFARVSNVTQRGPVRFRDSQREKAVLLAGDTDPV